MSTSMETSGSVAGCGYPQGLISRKKTLNDIMRMLRDDDISIIGIQGPAGTGKNIMAEKAAMLTAEQMLVDMIWIVVISQHVDTSAMDEKRPKYSNFILSTRHTRKERAECLSNKLRFTEKCKILVILSDVEEKLDLHDVQIPSGCKFVLTSKEKNMCEKMGAKIENVVEVGRLSAIEAHDLFFNHLGATVDSNDSKLILEKMLKSCKLLPLSIEMLANMLRNQRPTEWGSIAQNFEKFGKEENVGMSSEIYSVVKLSFSFILEEEKRLLFLLCCLSPSATCVDITNLLTYGIGLGLFEHLTSLVEVIDQAYTWIDELVSSSLFLKVDSKIGKIWIHDVVREAGRLLTKTGTGKRLFYVGAISPRHEEQTYRQYNAISMMPDSDCGDLHGWDFPWLELLLLSYTCVKELPDDYFIRMQNLKVLDLSNSRIESLPSSVIMLINLQTLLLDYSRIGVAGIHQICSMVSLQVLGLKGCNITTLPKEIGNLTKLKFLDLTDCRRLSTIRHGVLRSLTLLEGLLMKNSFSHWGREKNAKLSELKFLTCLRVLKISVETEQVEFDDGDLNFLSLVFFDINIEPMIGSLSPHLRDFGLKRSWSTHEKPRQSYFNDSLKEGTIMSRNLRALGMDADFQLRTYWRCLLHKSENLFLSKIEGLTDIVPSLDEDGLSGLHTIVVTRCKSMRYLINLSEGIKPLTIFRTLRSLVLSNLKSLEEIMFHWEPSEDLFPNLEEVVLSRLKRLKVISLPIPVTTRLKVLRVSDCESLEYIFTIHKVVEVEEAIANTSACEVKFFSLQELELRSIPRLRYFLKDRDSTVGESHEPSRDFLGWLTAATVIKKKETHEPFFSGKTEFPSLNVLQMHDLPCIMSIWKLDTTQEFSISFPNLQYLSLKDMRELRCVWGSSSRNLSIGSLKAIEILRCCSLSELVSLLESKTELKAISFPQLRTMKLEELSKLMHFCDGMPTLEFPALRELRLSSLDRMKIVFAKLKSSGALIHGKVPFTGPFPNLSCLYMSSMKRLRCLGRFEHDVNEGSQPISLGSMKDILISSCPELECLFSFTGTRHLKLHFHEGVSFPKLHRLELLELRSFRFLVSGRSSLQFPALTELIIKNLSSVDILIKVEKCITKDSVLLRGSNFHFPCLKILSLSGMPRLKMVIDTKEQGKGFGGEIIDHQIVFPQLEEITLKNMSLLRTFCSTSNPMEFLSLTLLDISECTYMESFSSSSTISTPKLYSIGDDYIAHRNIYSEAINKVIRGRRDRVQINQKLENWPPKLRHNLHNQHYIYKDKIAYKICDKCNVDEHTIFYSCAACDFHLHPECALEEGQLIQKLKNWPPRLRHNLHNQHYIYKDRIAYKICDKCNVDEYTIFYSCAACDFHLHPECALEEGQLVSQKEEGQLIQNTSKKGKETAGHKNEDWATTTEIKDNTRTSSGGQVETNFNPRSTASGFGQASSSNQSAPSHSLEMETKDPNLEEEAVLNCNPTESSPIFSPPIASGLTTIPIGVKTSIFDVQGSVTDNRFDMECSSLDEAWKLFQFESRLGGELLDSAEAYHYVETIVQKCNGLALVVKITARTLRMVRNLEELKLASEEFPSSTSTCDCIMQQLKFSYDRLKSQELKKCFLLTSLFEKGKAINVSMFINFMIEQGLCSEEMVDVNAWGHDLVRGLIDAALLESVQDDMAVTMHELVRDMALDVILYEAETFTNFGGSDLTPSRAAMFHGSENASSSAVLAHVGAKLKEPPSAEKWEQAQMVFLMDNEFPTLPEKLACPHLFALSLHKNSSLRVIPQNFFSSMPQLQVLNLSKTRISSLPQSLVNLTSLQELIMRDCKRLFILPEYVGKLTLLQVLDLQGTELSHLPDSIHELINLKKLMVSFYGAGDICELAKLPIVMSKDVISIPGLREVGIFVYPGDTRWESCANEISVKLSTMNLDAISIHFLQEEWFEAFIHNHNGQLKKFNIIVGRDAVRNASEIPYDVQLMYNHQERCLKFASGHNVSSTVKKVLEETNAFYLDHHVSISDLSEFGVANMSNLKLCIVRDCPVLLGCFLVRSVEVGSLSNMKVFELNSCPKVKFVFTWHALEILMTNLEQLIIEDCLSLESIVAKDNEDGRATAPAGHPKRLRVLRLHRLPQLKDVWSGRPWPCLEDLSISYCHKLKNLQLSRTCIDDIKHIRAEKAWWNSLEWDEEDKSVKHWLENNCKVVYFILDEEDDVYQHDYDDEDNRDTSPKSEEGTRHDKYFKGKSIKEGHESVLLSSHELPPYMKMGSVESSVREGAQSYYKPTKSCVPEIMSALEGKPDAKDMTDNQFDEVKSLPPEEAWKMFQSQSQLGGGVIDSLEVRQYADVIVEKCQGLDLIIKITARSLRSEMNPKEWELASRDFPSHTTSNTVHDHIMQQLKFSYGRLGSHELRKCFLLSSLFEKGTPIYFSTLLNHMIDQGWSSNEMDFNTWGHNLLRGLIAAGFLEPGEDHTTVRMHDLVRDMGLDVILNETETFDGFGGLHIMSPQSSVHNHSETRSSSLVLSQVGARRNQPPSIEKWEQAKMVFLMDNEFVHLPKELECSSLFALCLQRNSNLRIIPEHFFTNMSGLSLLNLSRTRIDSLPPSLTCLRSLRVMVLRECERLFILPEYVGELIHLQVLDLHGTKLYHLPDSIGRLKNLKKLLVSFYGMVDRSEAAKLPKIMSEEVISMPELREVGIFVYPGDMRWESCASEISVKLSNMNLDAISIHFLQEEWFEAFFHKHNGQLKKFNIIVGLDAERNASEIPYDVQLMYNHQERCLKLVSGHDVSSTVKKVLEETSAFYLDHHVTISDLSEFGLASMSNLKLCIVRDCPVLKCFLDTAILPECTLSNLRLLSLNSCPNVKFVLPWSAVEILNNLEQLIVQDCRALECIVAEEKDGDTILATSIPPISLRVVRLHMLPQLRDVWNGRPWPYLEDISISYCQKLKNLHLSSTSIDHIKYIRAEKTWWNSLEWNDGYDSLKNDLENNHKVVYIDCDIDRDDDQNEDEDLDHEN